MLDNRSTMSGEEFFRGVYELGTEVKKNIVAETFGRHPMSGI